MNIRSHKEEMLACKAANAVDREKLQQKLATLMHPQKDVQSREVTNITTGQLAPKVVNVDQFVETSRKQLRFHESGCPGSFQKPLTKNTDNVSVAD